MPTPRAQIVITILDTGQLTVSAPMQDKGTCYLMLECARDEIKKRHDELTASAIVTAQPGDIPHLSLRPD